MTSTRAAGIAICAAVLTVFAGSASSAEDDARAHEVSRLLQDIPSPARLEACKRLVAPAGADMGALSQTQTQKAAEMEQARVVLDRAKAAIPALRKLIKPGTSVFEYPGLLAHGYISYDEDGKTYESYIGFYPLRHEGRELYDFRIVFDASGQIIAVQDVIHKR